MGDYNHNQIEFMHQSHRLWYTASAYPFQEQIFGYATVARPGKVYILGGCCDSDWTAVTLFENDQWLRLGYLEQGRVNHFAFTYGTNIMIIGGSSKDNRP